MFVRTRFLAKTLKFNYCFSVIQKNYLHVDTANVIGNAVDSSSSQYQVKFLFFFFVSFKLKCDLYEFPCE